MKKKLFFGWLFLCACCMLGGNVLAQYSTDFFLTDMQDEVVKERVQQSLTKLLTEVNMAQFERRQPELVGCGLDGGAVSDVMALWKTSPFRCAETEVIEKCLQTPSGYQVRNIPLVMEPLDPEAYGDDTYQEAVVNFSRSGEITGVYFAIGMHLYSKVIRSNITVTDLRRRQVILDFVENFRTAYNRKDLVFLDQVFSDNALIITGKVVKSVKGGDNPFRLNHDIEYKRQTKQEYMANLRNVFNSNKMIRVIFDDIKVVKHPAKEHYYGVTLKQGFTSDRYHDVGYVFLLMDFKDETNPMIHVRTWQPDKYEDGTDLPADKIFSLSDFDDGE